MNNKDVVVSYGLGRTKKDGYRDYKVQKVISNLGGALADQIRDTFSGYNSQIRIDIFDTGRFSVGDQFSVKF